MTDKTDNTLSCPDDSITIPAPTTNDIKWAQKQKTPVSEENLRWAARRGQLWRIQYAVNSGTNIDQSVALIKAGAWGKADSVKLLCANGADPNIQDGKALHDTESIEVCKALIEAGANPLLPLLSLYHKDGDKAKRIAYAYQELSPEKFHKLGSASSKNTPSPYGTRDEKDHSNAEWEKTSTYEAVHTSIITMGESPQYIKRHFNFKSRKITSFIVHGDNISAPAFETFEEQNTNTEITSAYEYLHGKGSELGDINQYISKKQKTAQKLLGINK